MLQIEEEKSSPAYIKVVGVGGGGMNAINRMIHANLRGVQFMVINTDEQVLHKSEAEERIAIGGRTTRGMGAGGDPEMGQKAAQEDRDKIHQKLKGADMVFITAGMGGGTGTGAAPIVAEVARELGALTVGVVTLPFAMEGGRRMEHALRGLESLKDRVDTLITIRNDSIFKVIDRNTSVDVAFRLVDDILLNAVKGISDLINTAGLVNVDFADVKSIMGETGDAIMGAGEGVGENRISDAVNQAIHNALLDDVSIAGATALLINVCGGQDMSITDWKEVSELITAQVDANANIIIGLTIDEMLVDRIRVTVIATGFQKNRSEHKAIPKKAVVGGGASSRYSTLGTPVETHINRDLRNPSVEESPPVLTGYGSRHSMEETFYSGEDAVFSGSDDIAQRDSSVYEGRPANARSRGKEDIRYSPSAGKRPSSLERPAYGSDREQENLEIPAFLRRRG